MELPYVTGSGFDAYDNHADTHFTITQWLCSLTNSSCMYILVPTDIHEFSGDL